ncbi:MAG: phosphoribosylglycinamide formyltransferase [Epsilonproteobacteria bacterium]|nr:phosphoribosylglycinamide formyltransferase [Campylobacterota bacterium]
MSVKKIAILFSGEGTNLENLIKKLHNRVFDSFKVEVALSLTNNPNANGIKRALKYGIETVIVDHRDFEDRESFDERVVKEIRDRGCDLAVLAGFMRILTPIFTENIKALNIHPSLLPLFKGANALERSFKSDMKVGGVSVHKVTSELDGGEILSQECFNKEGMSFEEFENKIHQIEHRIYPKTVIKVLKSL